MEPAAIDCEYNGKCFISRFLNKKLKHQLYFILIPNIPNYMSLKLSQNQEKERNV